MVDLLPASNYEINFKISLRHRAGQDELSLYDCSLIQRAKVVGAGAYAAY